MKSPRMVASAVALGLVAAACGGDDSEPVATRQPADPTVTSEATPEESDEEMMEDVTTFSVTIENISGGYAASSSGVFNMTDGGAEPGPAFPGDIYSFDVYASPGDRLSFATMLVQSNDWFFAPGADGVELFDADGHPTSGDITDSIRLYDAGTEADQTPGEGLDQAPRQAGPDTGDADPDPTVRSVTDGAPAVDELVQVTVTPGESGLFTVSVQNVSGNSALPGPIGPGVFVVHPDGQPILSRGEADRGLGLEGLAEDGAAGPLGEALAETAGVASPLAPGV